MCTYATMRFDSTANCFLLKHVQARVPSVHGAPAGTGGTGNTGEDRGLHSSQYSSRYVRYLYDTSMLGSICFSFTHPTKTRTYCLDAASHDHIDRYVYVYIYIYVFFLICPTSISQVFPNALCKRWCKEDSSNQDCRVKTRDGGCLTAWLLACKLLYYAFQWLLQNENCVVHVESLWMNSCTKTNCDCAAFVSLIFVDASLRSCITT